MVQGFILSIVSMALLQSAVAQPLVRSIVVVLGCHPAVMSAANLLAKEWHLPEGSVLQKPDSWPLHKGEVLLTTNLPDPTQARELGLNHSTLPNDAFGVVCKDGAWIVFGQRPRSLLFAAGDVDQWEEMTSGAILRKPAFSFRSASVNGHYSVAECVARLGVNIIIGRADAPVTFKKRLPAVFYRMDAMDRGDVDVSAEEAERAHQALAAQCHEADVEYYPLLYGNDFSLWSPALYEAAVRVFPSTKGVDEANSWEKGTLCPSDTNTWRLVRAYVAEFIERSHADGLYATFWDHYGIYCQCDRCQKDGLNQFSNELSVCVSNYQSVAESMGCPLIVRTWSSGVPHWLGDQWVHAPGNGGPSGSGQDLWGPVIRDVPESVSIQTKVYAADCQPNPPFSDLLGKASLHREIAEYQITGQTTGRLFLPASEVDYTAWTMQRSHALVGNDGGVSLFCGATKNPGYHVFGDAVNGINLYAWRRLSWDPEESLSQIWLDWARKIYGDKAAPAVVRALRRSEYVIHHLFSALGLGNDTNSGFAGSIARREVLLKYTNRYFLPEGQAALAPTLENVDRVIKEKEECLRQIQAMKQDIESVAGDLQPAQLAELRTRVNWLEEFGQVERYLDESLWRYRYLREKSNLLETDADQMAMLAAAYDQVRQHFAMMFKMDPGQRFSCYSVPLGDLGMKPTLGNPLPLVNELYASSLGLVQGALGPQSVPTPWLRGKVHPPAGVWDGNLNEGE